MRVAEVRDRVVKKLEEAAASGDENVATEVSNFSRAVLIALASYDADTDVDLQELKIKTSTAGRILGMSQEYVRELVRGKVLDATKKNGEFQVALSSVVSFQANSAARPGRPQAIDLGAMRKAKIRSSFAFLYDHGPRERPA